MIEKADWNRKILSCGWRGKTKIVGETKVYISDIDEAKALRYQELLRVENGKSTRKHKNLNNFLKTNATAF